MHYSMSMKCHYEGCRSHSTITGASGASYCRKHSHLLSHIEEVACPKGCGKLSYKPVYIRAKVSVENIRNSPAHLLLAVIFGFCLVISRELVFLVFAAAALYHGAGRKQDFGKGKYVCKNENEFGGRRGCNGVLIDSKSMSFHFMKENYERIISKINGERNSSLVCTICNQKMENIPINYWFWVDNPIKYLRGWWKEKKGDFDACLNCSMFWFGEDYERHSKSPVNPTAMSRVRMDRKSEF